MRMNMKRFKWIGLVILLLVVAAGIYSAMETGEKSPVFVSGTIEVAPNLTGDAQGVGTMFVILFDEGSAMPMPFGAMKEHLPSGLSKPIPFLVTKESLQRMNPDAPLPKSLRVKVRFDKDGVAGPDQPGDLVGSLTEVAFGERKAQIKVDQRI